MQRPIEQTPAVRQMNSFKMVADRLGGFWHTLGSTISYYCLLSPTYDPPLVLVTTCVNHLSQTPTLTTSMPCPVLAGEKWASSRTTADPCQRGSQDISRCKCSINTYYFQSTLVSSMNFFFLNCVSCDQSGWGECECESVSCSVVCDSLQPHGLQPTRLPCPWHSPGKNTGLGCCALLQGIFLTPGWNLCLL